MSSLVIDVAQEKATDYQRILARPPLHKGGFAHGDDGKTKTEPMVINMGPHHPLMTSSWVPLTASATRLRHRDF
ncbi:MAG: hypothetical protein F6K42_38340 [Leptolyngbya sp. SIO1D8]|nr:hypothetical protein [Leptolyngbya sp. SIO1D8]